MWQFAVRHLIADLRRVLAVFLATLLAVTSFLVLTGSAQRQRLALTDTVNQNFRGTYDLLVRPQSSVLPLENQQDLYQSVGLTTTYGGITIDQLRQIRGTQGVEVAAPLAVVGLVQNQFEPFYVDVTDLIGPRQDRALVRWSSTESARQGNVSFAGPSGYMYFTRGQLDPKKFTEVVDGQLGSPCILPSGPAKPGKADDREGAMKVVVQRRDSSCIDKTMAASRGLDPNKDYVGISMFNVPYLVAAVDPVAENALVGLDTSLISGTGLADFPATVNGTQRERDVRIPMLLSSQAGVEDRGMDVTVERLSPQDAKQWAVGPFKQSQERIKYFDSVPATGMMQFSFGPEQLWSSSSYAFAQIDDLTAVNLDKTPGLILGKYNRTAPLSYSVGADRSLTVTNKSVIDSPFYNTALGLDGGPRTWNEATFEKGATNPSTLMVVGKFDATKLNFNASSLGVSGAESYLMSPIQPGDDASLSLIGEKYLPTSNAADYAQPGVQALIPIDALPSIYPERSNAAPISSVRVRVAGITGNDDVSRERLRLVAEDIQEQTGLRVDIATGSSTTDQVVHIPATKTLPALTLKEPWTKKGVAVTIVSAVDAKSLTLFLLILVSAIIAVSVTARATANSRKTENAVLAAVGWRPLTLIRELSLEFAFIGLAAGIAGALIAIPAAKATHISFDPRRAILAVPIAALVCLLAGFGAAVSSSRVKPVDALRGVGDSGSQVRLSHGSPEALGLTMTFRHPGRLLLAILSAAIGVTTLTFVRAIDMAFKGRVIGTRLGDAVSLQTTREDGIAAICLVVLSLITLAIVLFTGIMEDIRTYATLDAIGWRYTQTNRVVAVQGFAIGLIGALLGAVLGLLLTRWVAGQSVNAAIFPSIGIALIVVVAAVLIALICATSLRHLPLPQILARD